MNRYNRARLLTATALALFASLAHAQYMWIDEKGMKQLSDRPPPPSIPQKNILKAPPGMATAATLAPEAPAASASASASASAQAAANPPSLADRSADFRKRAKEKDEREQKDAAAAAEKLAKAEECDRTQAYKQSLASGMRVSTTEKNGERGFMSDEQRAAETRKADKTLAGCK